MASQFAVTFKHFNREQAKKMSVLEKVKKTLPGQLLLVSTLIISGAIINFIQLLLNISVKPFNRALFNNLMYYVNYGWICRKLKREKLPNIILFTCVRDDVLISGFLF